MPKPAARIRIINCFFLVKYLYYFTDHLKCTALKQPVRCIFIGSFNRYCLDARWKPGVLEMRWNRKVKNYHLMVLSPNLIFRQLVRESWQKCRLCFFKFRIDCDEVSALPTCEHASPDIVKSRFVLFSRTNPINQDSTTKGPGGCKRRCNVYLVLR